MIWLSDIIALAKVILTLGIIAAKSAMLQFVIISSLCFHVLKDLSKFINTGSFKKLIMPILVTFLNDKYLKKDKKKWFNKTNYFLPQILP